MLSSPARASQTQKPRSRPVRAPQPTGELPPAAPYAGPEPADGFTPIPISRLEMAADFAVPEVNRNSQIHLLVTLHGIPVGTCWELPTAASPEALRDSLFEQFAEPLSAHLMDDGLTRSDLTPAPDRPAHRCHFQAPAGDGQVSVVIATLGREPKLIDAVGSVLAQTHDQLELIVVDNDPASGAARSELGCLEDPRLRILDEPRRGTSFARTAGLHAAHGDVVAFIDDDVIADERWLSRLIVPFDQDQSVNCVTGLVLPAQLDTQAQAWFEEYGAFDKGFTRTVWSMTEERPAISGQPGSRGALFPYSAGLYGSGNNMAFRREALKAIGGFDPALGGGAPVRGGEDLDVFLGVILSGATLVYEPPAMVRHYARRTLPELSQQIFGYGSGMAALIVKQLIDGRRPLRPLLSRIPAGVRRLLDPRSSKNARKTSDYPRRLTFIELSGYAAAPWLYLRSRHRRDLMPLDG